MPEPAIFLMTLTILVNLLDSANLVAIINAEVVTMVAITTPMEIEMAVEIGLAEDDTSSLLKPVHIIHPDLDLVTHPSYPTHQQQWTGPPSWAPWHTWVVPPSSCPTPPCPYPTQPWAGPRPSSHSRSTF